jgi:hypothetical protein
MKLAKEALVAILAAAWVVGLVEQLGSWKMTLAYVAISLAMAAVVFGDHPVLKLAPRRNRPPDRH